MEGRNGLRNEMRIVWHAVAKFERTSMLPKVEWVFQIANDVLQEQRKERTDVNQEVCPRSVFFSFLFSVVRPPHINFVWVFQPFSITFCFSSSGRSHARCYPPKGSDFSILICSGVECVLLPHIFFALVYGNKLQINLYNDRGFQACRPTKKMPKWENISKMPTVDILRRNKPNILLFCFYGEGSAYGQISEHFANLLS